MMFEQPKEIDIEHFIWEMLSTKGGFMNLARRGILFEGLVYRQFKIPNCGIPDLFCIKIVRDKENKRILAKTIVYELKKGEACMKDFGQASRYDFFIRGTMSTIFNNRGAMPGSFHHEHQTYLVAPSFERDVLIAAKSTWGHVFLSRIVYDMSKGISFSEINPHEYTNHFIANEDPYRHITVSEIYRKSGAENTEVLFPWEDFIPENKQAIQHNTDQTSKPSAQ